MMIITLGLREIVSPRTCLLPQNELSLRQQVVLHSRPESRAGGRTMRAHSGRPRVPSERPLTTAAEGCVRRRPLKRVCVCRCGLRTKGLFGVRASMKLALFKRANLPAGRPGVSVAAPPTPPR
eukprot:364228-Chlamydomonas_euryale.AAC.26